MIERKVKSVKEIFKEVRENSTFRDHIKNIALIAGVTLPLILIVLICVLFIGVQVTEAWLLITGLTLGGACILFNRYVLGTPMMHELKEHFRSQNIIK